MTEEVKRKRASPVRSPSDVKALVRHRDGYRCTDCGMSARQHVKRYGRNLDVHRVSPGSEYSIKGCITLCRQCHRTKPKLPRGTAPSRAGMPLRIRQKFVDALSSRLNSRSTDLTTEVNRIVYEYCTSNGLLPPETSQK